jgi:hypothetical protein
MTESNHLKIALDSSALSWKLLFRYEAEINIPLYHELNYDTDSLSEVINHYPFLLQRNKVSSMAVSHPEKNRAERNVRTGKWQR